MVGCSCAVCPVSTVLCRCQAPQRHAPPGCFGRRGCKLLKIKNGGVEKESKERPKRLQIDENTGVAPESPREWSERGRSEGYTPGQFGWLSKYRACGKSNS